MVLVAAKAMYAFNNGLLEDPLDQEAVADALLKLLGATCRMRHPQCQTNIPEDNKSVEESLNDSLKDEQDMLSLRFSIDGDLVAASGVIEVQSVSHVHQDANAITKHI
ncbi:hypothetical protein VNO77_10650 [Canavalia gladiata]|uniref:Uncharacterized protein n=1 Tax=Canavalia gladiata TaxID=3824 RepID=A0AAN9MED7_CANGL